MASKTTSADVFVCAECGERFKSTPALNAHQAKHKNEQQPRKFSVQAEVAEAMRELVAPLRVQLDDVDARIARSERELNDLRKARTQLQGVLNKLDPQAKPKTTSTTSNGARTAQHEQKLATLRKLIADEPQLFVDGITLNTLAGHWRDKQLKPQATINTLRPCFEQLMNEGIIRQDRVTKGGGMSWKLVGVNGSGPDA